MVRSLAPRRRGLEESGLYEPGGNWRITQWGLGGGGLTIGCGCGGIPTWDLVRGYSVMVTYMESAPGGGPTKCSMYRSLLLVLRWANVFLLGFHVCFADMGKLYQIKTSEK